MALYNPYSNFVYETDFDDDDTEYEKKNDDDKDE